MEYESKFDNLVEDWQHNIKELVKKLVKRDDVDSLFYLSENYNIKKYVSYYAGLYGKQNLIDIGLASNYLNVAAGSINGNKLEIFKSVIKNVKDKNYQKLASIAIKYNRLDFLKYLTDISSLNLNDLSKKALKYENQDALKYIENLESAFLLPDDILIEILMKMQKISKYRSISKHFKELIDYLIKKYETEYSKFSKNKDWKNENKISLAKKLIDAGKYEALIFLMRNYNLTSREKTTITFYVVSHKNLELLKSGAFNDVKGLAEGAAYIGDLELLEKQIAKGYKDYDVIGYYAAMGGNENIIKISLEKGAYIEQIAKGAAYGNHLDIVKWLYNKYKNKLNVQKIADYGARGGNLDIILWARSIPDSDIDVDSIAFNAAIKDRENIIDWAIKNGLRDYAYIAYGAAKDCHFDKVKQIAQMQDVELDYQVFSNYAARYNCKEMLWWAIKKGGNDFQTIADQAALGGNLDIIEDIYKIEEFDVNIVASNAVSKDHKNILIWALNNGADNYADLYATAIINNKEDIAEFLEQYAKENDIDLEED